MAKVYVFLPDDETDEWPFEGVPYVLQPEQATLIESKSPTATDDEVANHIVDHLGKWGAAKVSGPVKNGKAENKADQAIVDAAVLRYLENTKKWAEERILAYERDTKALSEAGLALPPQPKEVETGRAWLEKKRRQLKEAGLIA